jgi:hypothetical protein
MAGAGRAGLAVLLVITGSCATVPLGTSALPPCAGPPAQGDAWAAYFPEGRLAGANRRADNFERHWYGGELAAMHEPVLSCARAAATPEVYRFTYLRSFHSAWVFRIERTAAGANVYAIEGSGPVKLGDEPGPPSQHFIVRRSTQEWARLESVLAEARFWNESLHGSREGEDGAEWLFEGLRNGEYHLVDRWSPGGSFEKLGRLFIDLAGQTGEIDPIY